MDGVFPILVKVPWNEFRAKFFHIFRTNSILWNLLGDVNSFPKLFVDLEI